MDRSPLLATPAAERPESDRPLRYGTGYRSDIQGMRAIAVLVVVLYHAGIPFLSGGFVGVDVFFVLSGFLITGIMASELERTSKFRLSRFYAKRILRIIPAATLVLVATAAATAVWVPVTQWKSIATEIIGSALYVVNWQLAATTNYLNAEALPSPLQHFWSLAVEEQYYLLWPAVFVVVLLLARRALRRRAQSPALLALRALPWVVLAVLVLSFAFSVLAMQRWPSAAYFVTPTRIWELAVGSLLAFTVPWLRRLPRWCKRLLTLGGLAAVFGAATMYSSATAFPGASALLPVVGTAAMLAGGLPHSPDEPRSHPVLGHPVPVWFGNISYALYLWHWPILIVAEARFGELGVPIKLTLVVLAVGLAAASTYWFEQPLRSARLLRTSTPRAFALGAVAIVVSILAASFLWVSVNAKTAAPSNANAPGATSIEDGGVPPQVTGALPENLSPNLLTAAEDNPRIYVDDCHLEPEDDDVRECAYGDPDGPLVLLAGDSHAAQWFPTLEVLADERGFRLVSMTKSSCPIADFPLELTGKEREYTECVRWNEGVQQYIEREQPALVVTSSLEVYTEWGGEESPDAFVHGLETSWDRIAGRGVPVLVLADTPYMSSNVPDCLAQNASAPEKCRTPHGQAFEASGALEEASAGREGVRFLDLNDKICPGDECEPVIGDVLVYRDQHHLSATYARTLAAVLEERAADLLPGGSA